MTRDPRQIEQDNIDYAEAVAARDEGYEDGLAGNPDRTAETKVPDHYAPGYEEGAAERTLNDWPDVTECIHCGKPSALLGATYDKAEYECRGNPTDPRSAYGDDRCGRVFTVERNAR